MYPRFEFDIQEMNDRYKLSPINVASWADVIKRLEQFKDILDKEFNELGDIETLTNTADDTNWGQPGALGHLPVEVVVNMADLLADIIVYCASEAQRWGIPLPAVLMIVMASNSSKLGADGQPIIDPTNGKFLKGPNYWKPEPAIEYIMTHENSKGLKFMRSESGVVTYAILEQQEEVQQQNLEAAHPAEKESGGVHTEHPPGVQALDESGSNSPASELKKPQTGASNDQQQQSSSKP